MVNPRPDNASTRRAIMGCAVLVGLFLCVTSIAVAQDSHYWTNQYGTRAQLLGGLVVGSFVDLSSTYYNPGTMALVSDRGVLLTTDAFQLVDIEFDDLLGSGLDISQQRVRSFTKNSGET